MRKTFDPLNVDAALQGFPVSLSKPDRVVAAKTLTALGMKAEEVADRLGVTDRQIERYKSEPMPEPEEPLVVDYEFSSSEQMLVRKARTVIEQLHSKDHMEVLGDCVDFCAWHPGLAAQVMCALALWADSGDWL
ncbi:hypothetical protein [Mycobacteroides abscessus]|uniref:Uncharacterized protein n=2 Tax=Mycobacteroides abscessus TaxID=36809 RepID=A0A829M8L5_9MYCO|nr:hypothetical protein [Mycobacteroides abscessus]ESV58893.1 hypothetical protein L830_4745 [Mycobacteroides abscessus MAB_082312_2258]ESV62275.1 hypothetical protein L833_4680 [Mycobacteroides abscessus MAB_091912_2446]QSM04437.1 helix-turn-helix DNA binding domain protein [Mycobacterium phage prophiGD02-2]QST87300.1 helix-turn-helix DNA binding domain protein [Mycobacterium phage prophiGD90-1]AWG55581.1 hypothetical protein DDT53_16040 [Mycobacteroides abscessus]